MHGTHYLRLINNVVYEGKGHIFFIEDAIETNNYLADNLVMKVKRSWSLLNTDQSPAGFWLTHPNNILLGNHVGGSDRYGFWYDLQEHAMGPSANLDVCPENERVGEFANNAAHTMGRYGLRIFHTMEPRTYPCQPMVYDESNSDDPYWQNPPIEANFWNYTGWKCNRDGAIGKKLGWVKFNNFKAADNRETGIQMSQTFLIGNYSGVFGNNLVVGQSNNTEPALLRSNPTGVVGPRTENWVANGIKFYNFNWGEAACFGSCSHCCIHKVVIMVRGNTMSPICTLMTPQSYEGLDMERHSMVSITISMEPLLDSEQAPGLLTSRQPTISQSAKWI